MENKYFEKVILSQILNGKQIFRKSNLKLDTKWENKYLEKVILSQILNGKQIF